VKAVAHYWVPEWGAGSLREELAKFLALSLAGASALLAEPDRMQAAGQLALARRVDWRALFAGR
jgi:hypothetical protein